MRIEPKGLLADWLRERGLSQHLAGFEVDDTRLAGFLAEAPYGCEEFRAAYAAYCALLHPGPGAPRTLQQAMASVDAVIEAAPETAPGATVQAAPGAPVARLWEWRVYAWAGLALLLAGLVRC